MTHTPGPWEATYSKRMDQWTIRYVRPTYAFQEDREVALILTSLDHKLDTANARLIAAAPDLLAALQTLMDLIELRGPRSIAPHKSPIEELRATLTKADYEAARAAIAKAKGDQA